MGEIDNQMKSVSFTRMADGTAEEYAFLNPLYEKCRNGVSDRLLELLKAMKGANLVIRLTVIPTASKAQLGLNRTGPMKKPWSVPCSTTSGT